MARRRKKSRGAPKAGQSATNAAKEKALPSLPRDALPQRAFSPDGETPLSESQSGTPGAGSPSQNQGQIRRDLVPDLMKNAVSALSEDARKGELARDICKR